MVCIEKQFEFQEMKERTESRECAANISSFFLTAKEVCVCVYVCVCVCVDGPVSE